MASTNPDKLKEMWVEWTHDAMNGYERPEDGIEHTDDAADDMVEVTTKYADSMLDEYEKRFATRATRGGKRRKRGEDEDEEEDDDD